MASRQKTKIQNPFLYAYGLLAKLLAALLFALLSPLLAAALLLARLIFRKKAMLTRLSGKVVSMFCGLFITLLRAIRFMKLKLTDEDRKRLKSLRSTMVVANHPSVLDLPLLLALVPKARLILSRPGQAKPPFPASLFTDAYITADSWGGLLAECKDSLAAGDNIIIFPERLLTPREGTNPYRRTAARLARECGRDIQPLYIGGSDKYGLGSPAAPLAYCRAGLYLYELKLLPLIAGAEYAELKDREASVAVTKKIHDEISAEAYLRDYRIV